MSSDTDARCLETFPEWLRTLGADADALAAVVVDEAVPEAARRALAGGLNYVFKSVDLIPDGIDDIGYLDDAFVLRVAASHAVAEGLGADAHGGVAGLAEGAALVREFLGADHERLERYVTALRKGHARGRSVDDIVANAGVRGDFVADVKGFARGYSAPAFSREEKSLIKLRAFLGARLPR